MTAPASDCKTCTTASGERGRGWAWAVATAVLCPCHLPVWGMLLAGTAAGTFYHQYFWALFVIFCALTLFALYRATRILL